MTKTHDPSSSDLALETLIAETASEAFASVRAEIEAVPQSAIAPNNLEIPRAARRGLAVAARLEPLVPALARLPELDFGSVERMGTYALAVLHTHELVIEGGSARTPPLSALLDEASPLRELMLSSAEVLALVGLVSPERVAAIRSGHGHADTANDLQALGRLYRESWNDVHDKVVVTLPMIERAVALSALINKALGVREIDEDPLVESHDPKHLRAQAFSLFVRAYEECRRGVTFLRWHHGDARSIVPSLYPPRTRRRKATGPASDEREGSPLEASESTGEERGATSAGRTARGSDQPAGADPASERLFLAEVAVSG